MNAERHPDVWEDRLLDLACEALPPGEAREVEAHAAGCAPCRETLARMQATRRTMAALGPEPAPSRGEAALLAAARAQAARNAGRRRRRVALWLAPTAAAAGLAVVISWQVLGGRPELPGRGDPEALAMRSPPAPAAEAEAPRKPAPRTFATPPEGGSAVATAPTPPTSAERRVSPAPPADASARMASRPAAARPAAPEPARREREEEVDYAQAPVVAAPAPAPPAAAAASEAAPPEAAMQRRAPAAAKARGAVPEATASTARAEAPAAADRRDEPAPEPSAMAGAEPPGRAGVAAGASAADEARARYASLRAAGQLRGEIRTFPGCDGEAWRKVELDREGRVVSYVREGTVDGRRVRIEHLYDASGALAASTAFDLDAGGPGRPARALGLAVPLRAADAGPDAPPRCGR